MPCISGASREPVKRCCPAPLVKQAVRVGAGAGLDVGIFRQDVGGVGKKSWQGDENSRSWWKFTTTGPRNTGIPHLLSITCRLERHLRATVAEVQIMKSKLIAGLVLAAGTLLAEPRFSVGVVIGGGPSYYAAARPPCPGPGYYWVDGYWFADRGYRSWQPGYWAAPRYYAPPRYYNNYRGRDWDRREDRREEHFRDERRYRR